MASLGQNLLRIRKTCKLTQQQLADGVGVSRVAIARWEKDESVPHARNLKQLAQFYDLKVKQLQGAEKIDLKALATKFSVAALDTGESSTPPSAAALTDFQLMREVARRYRQQAEKADQYFQRYKARSLADIAESLFDLVDHDSIPDDLKSEIEDRTALSSILDKTINQFLPSRWVEKHSNELPAWERHPLQYDADYLLEEHDVLFSKEHTNQLETLILFLQMHGIENLRPLMAKIKSQISYRERNRIGAIGCLNVVLKMTTEVLEDRLSSDKKK